MTPERSAEIVLSILHSSTLHLDGLNESLVAAHDIALDGGIESIRAKIVDVSNMLSCLQSDCKKEIRNLKAQRAGADQ